PAAGRRRSLRTRARRSEAPLAPAPTRRSRPPGSPSGRRRPPPGRAPGEPQDAPTSYADPVRKEGGGRPLRVWLVAFGRGDGGLDILGNTLRLFGQHALHRRRGLLPEGALIDINEGHSLLDQRLTVEVVLLLLDFITILTSLLDGFTQQLLVRCLEAIPPTRGSDPVPGERQVGCGDDVVLHLPHLAGIG